MKRGLASAVVLALCVGLASAAHAGERPRAGAAGAVNSLVVTATNATPPDRVGKETSVKFEGAIIARGRKKGPRRCRQSRDIEISNTVVHPPGAVRTEYAKPTPASGRFKVTAPPYEYGGIDPSYPEEGPRSGDIGFEGGTLVFSVVVRKLKIAYPHWYDTYVCKRLTATASVQVPPAITG